MNIISTIQQHYSKKSTLSISAPIADVRKTFIAIVETGLYVDFATFEVQYNDSIVQLYGPRGIKATPLMTTIYLEPELDLNSTTFNINTQFTKNGIIANLIGCFIAFLFIVHIYLQISQIKLDRLWILSLPLIDGVFTYYYIWMNFKFSRNFLIKYLQRVQVWNGLGSHKRSIINTLIHPRDNQN